MEVERMEGRSFTQPPPPLTAGPSYTLPNARLSSEDILFCIDAGPETMAEMKINGPNARPYTRLDSIKQAVVLFVHAKLAANPDHRFAFAASPNPPIGCFDFTVHLSSFVKLRKEFSSEPDLVNAALRGIQVDSSSNHADLTQLFRIATHEAKKSRAQGRIFRLVLLYCRSSTPPQYQLPSTLKLFTLDVMYLHDKPGPENDPQMVYDTLVDAAERVSEHDSYIFESGQGLTRTLFRHMCLLLCHPQQRCIQDEMDIPKSLTKRSPAVDSGQPDDSYAVVVSSQ